jgi:hypothetical protein
MRMPPNAGCEGVVEALAGAGGATGGTGATPTDSLVGCLLIDASVPRGSYPRGVSALRQQRDCGGIASNAHAAFIPGHAQGIRAVRPRSRLRGDGVILAPTFRSCSTARYPQTRRTEHRVPRGEMGPKGRKMNATRARHGKTDAAGRTDADASGKFRRYRGPRERHALRRPGAAVAACSRGARSNRSATGP